MSPAVRHPFLDHDGPIGFVHRGGPVGASENTLDAFERAYRLGFRWFETDVHATRDGVLVAFHDRTLRRLAGDPVAIGDLTWDEVSQVRVEGQAVPRLVELLEAFPDARVNLDPKHDAAVGPLARLVRGCLDRVCLASFSDRRLRFLRAALGPQACTAAGPREIARFAVAVRARRPGELVADVLQVPVGPRAVPLVDDAFLAAAHSLGRPVHVWTVNDADEIVRLVDLGVDGVMSDDPLALREVLRSRGFWPPSPRASLS